MSAGATAHTAGSLLAELAAQWRLASQDAEHGVLRACSMTFIVLAGDGDEQELGAILAELMTEHPARALVLRLNDRAGDTFEARTLIQCWRPFGGRRQVCCEQIEMLVGAGAISEARRLILGLLVPDLPVMLWVRDPRWLGQFGAEVFSIAGKTILDSARLRVPAAFRALDSLPVNRRADLAWTRLTRWRQLVHSIADGRRILRATLRYAGPDLPASALYLGAWLRSAHDSAMPLEFASEGPDRPPAGHGLLRALELETEDGAIRLQRPAGIYLEACAGGRPAQYCFPLFTAQYLLREELSIPGSDPAFELALSHAHAILSREGLP